MANGGMSDLRMPTSGPVGQTSVGAPPVALCYAMLALVMTTFWLAGLRLNGDLDDLLKLHEIRHLVETRDIFDRTLPGILQPEPYVTHWPWIVDLPYAAVAWLLTPLTGAPAALATATFAVPLLLLFPAVLAYRRLVYALGFARPGVALCIAALFAMRGFFEFAPGRIDYHNLQIVLCLAALVLTLSQARGAAFANGILAALALAISLEFAAFYALVTALYAWEFVFSRERGDGRLAGFGAGLALGGAALFALIVPPSAYGAIRCDTYSLPHFSALAGGGVLLALSPWAVRGRSIVWRIAILALAGGVLLAMLAQSFPQCRAGPYGALSDYVRQMHLSRINQEKSLFGRPEFVMSESFASMAVLFVGALVPAVLVLTGRARDRAMVVFALFSLLSLAQAIAYFRYFRYLPFFSGIGLVIALGAILPSARAKDWLANRFAVGMPGIQLAAPGVVLACGLALFHLARTVPADQIPAAEFADSCDLTTLTAKWNWPAEARVLSPPNTGLSLLSLPGAPTVVAIPHHPAWRGIERAYRFLDPSTGDPQVLLRESEATHVAVCAWRGAPLPGLAERYPLAAALMEGRPPGWLTGCATDADSPIRIYAVRREDAATPACPVAGSGG
jgi:hypothetical protein